MVGLPPANGDEQTLLEALNHDEQAVEADGDADLEAVDLERQLQERGDGRWGLG